MIFQFFKYLLLLACLLSNFSSASRSPALFTANSPNPLTTPTREISFLMALAKLVVERQGDNSSCLNLFILKDISKWLLEVVNNRNIAEEYRTLLSTHLALFLGEFSSNLLNDSVNSFSMQSVEPQKSSKFANTRLDACQAEIKLQAPLLFHPSINELKSALKAILYPSDSKASLNSIISKLSNLINLLTALIQSNQSYMLLEGVNRLENLNSDFFQYHNAISAFDFPIFAKIKQANRIPPRQELIAKPIKKPKFIFALRHFAGCLSSSPTIYYQDPLLRLLSGVIRIFEITAQRNSRDFRNIIVPIDKIVAVTQCIHAEFIARAKRFHFSADITDKILNLTCFLQFEQMFALSTRLNSSLNLTALLLSDFEYLKISLTAELYSQLLYLLSHFSVAKVSLQSIEEAKESAEKLKLDIMSHSKGQDDLSKYLHSVVDEFEESRQLANIVTFRHVTPPFKPRNQNFIDPNIPPISHQYLYELCSNRTVFQGPVLIDNQYSIMSLDHLKSVCKIMISFSNDSVIRSINLDDIGKLVQIFSLPIDLQFLLSIYPHSDSPLYCPLTGLALAIRRHISNINVTPLSVCNFYEYNGPAPFTFFQSPISSLERYVYSAVAISNSLSSGTFNGSSYNGPAFIYQYFYVLFLHLKRKLFHGEDVRKIIDNFTFEGNENVLIAATSHLEFSQYSSLFKAVVAVIYCMIRRGLIAKEYRYFAEFSAHKIIGSIPLTVDVPIPYEGFILPVEGSWNCRIMDALPKTFEVLDQFQPLKFDNLSMLLQVMDDLLKMIPYPNLKTFIDFFKEIEYLESRLIFSLKPTFLHSEFLSFHGIIKSLIRAEIRSFPADLLPLTHKYLMQYGNICNFYLFRPLADEIQTFLSQSLNASPLLPMLLLSAYSVFAVETILKSRNIAFSRLILDYHYSTLFTCSFDWNVGAFPFVADFWYGWLGSVEHDPIFYRVKKLSPSLPFTIKVIKGSKLDLYFEDETVDSMVFLETTVEASRLFDQSETGFIKPVKQGARRYAQPSTVLMGSNISKQRKKDDNENNNWSFIVRLFSLNSGFHSETIPQLSFAAATWDSIACEVPSSALNFSSDVYKNFFKYYNAQVMYAHSFAFLRGLNVVYGSGRNNPYDQCFEMIEVVEKQFNEVVFKLEGSPFPYKQLIESGKQVGISSFHIPSPFYFDALVNEAKWAFEKGSDLFLYNTGDLLIIYMYMLSGTLERIMLNMKYPSLYFWKREIDLACEFFGSKLFKYFYASKYQGLASLVQNVRNSLEYEAKLGSLKALENAVFFVSRGTFDINYSLIRMFTILTRYQGSLQTSVDYPSFGTFDLSDRVWSFILTAPRVLAQRSSFYVDKMRGWAGSWSFYAIGFESKVYSDIFSLPNSYRQLANFFPSSSNSKQMKLSKFLSKIPACSSLMIPVGQDRYFTLNYSQGFDPIGVFVKLLTLDILFPYHFPLTWVEMKKFLDCYPSKVAFHDSAENSILVKFSKERAMFFSFPNIDSSITAVDLERLKLSIMSELNLQDSSDIFYFHNGAEDNLTALRSDLERKKDLLHQYHLDYALYFGKYVYEKLFPSGSFVPEEVLNQDFHQRLYKKFNSSHNADAPFMNPLVLANVDPDTEKSFYIVEPQSDFDFLTIEEYQHSPIIINDPVVKLFLHRLGYCALFSSHRILKIILKKIRDPKLDFLDAKTLALFQKIETTFKIMKKAAEDEFKDKKFRKHAIKSMKKGVRDFMESYVLFGSTYMPLWCQFDEHFVIPGVDIKNRISVAQQWDFFKIVFDENLVQDILNESKNFKFDLPAPIEVSSQAKFNEEFPPLAPSIKSASPQPQVTNAPLKPLNISLHQNGKDKPSISSENERKSTAIKSTVDTNQPIKSVEVPVVENAIIDNENIKAKKKNRKKKSKTKPKPKPISPKKKDPVNNMKISENALTQNDSVENLKNSSIKAPAVFEKVEDKKSPEKVMPSASKVDSANPQTPVKDIGKVDKQNSADDNSLKEKATKNQKSEIEKKSVPAKPEVPKETASNKNAKAKANSPNKGGKSKVIANQKDKSASQNQKISSGSKKPVVKTETAVKKENIVKRDAGDTSVKTAVKSAVDVPLETKMEELTIASKNDEVKQPENKTEQKLKRRQKKLAAQSSVTPVEVKPPFWKYSIKPYSNPLSHFTHIREVSEYMFQLVSDGTLPDYKEVHRRIFETDYKISFDELGASVLRMDERNLPKLKLVVLGSLELLAFFKGCQEAQKILGIFMKYITDLQSMKKSDSEKSLFKQLENVGRTYLYFMSLIIFLRERIMKDLVGIVECAFLMKYLANGEGTMPDLIELIEHSEIQAVQYYGPLCIAIVESSRFLVIEKVLDPWQCCYFDYHVRITISQYPCRQKLMEYREDVANGLFESSKASVDLISKVNSRFSVFSEPLKIEENPLEIIKTIAAMSQFYAERLISDNQSDCMISNVAGLSNLHLMIKNIMDEDFNGKLIRMDVPALIGALEFADSFLLAEVNDAMKKKNINILFSRFHYVELLSHMSFFDVLLSDPTLVPSHRARSTISSLFQLKFINSLFVAVLHTMTSKDVKPQESSVKATQEYLISCRRIFKQKGKTSKLSFSDFALSEEDIWLFRSPNCIRRNSWRMLDKMTFSPIDPTHYKKQTTKSVKSFCDKGIDEYDLIGVNIKGSLYYMNKQEFRSLCKVLLFDSEVQGLLDLKESKPIEPVLWFDIQNIFGFLPGAVKKTLVFAALYEFSSHLSYKEFKQAKQINMSLPMLTNSIYVAPSLHEILHFRSMLQDSFDIHLGANCSLWTSEVKSTLPSRQYVVTDADNINTELELPRDLKENSVPMEVVSKDFKSVPIEEFEADQSITSEQLDTTDTSVLEQLNFTESVVPNTWINYDGKKADKSAVFSLPFPQNELKEFPAYPVPFHEVIPGNVVGFMNNFSKAHKIDLKESLRNVLLFWGYRKVAKSDSGTQIFLSLEKMCKVLINNTKELVAKDNIVVLRELLLFKKTFDILNSNEILSTADAYIELSYGLIASWYTLHWNAVEILTPADESNPLRLRDNFLALCEGTKKISEFSAYNMKHSSKAIVAHSIAVKFSIEVLSSLIRIFNLPFENVVSLFDYFDGFQMKSNALLFDLTESIDMKQMTWENICESLKSINHLVEIKPFIFAYKMEFFTPKLFNHLHHSKIDVDLKDFTSFCMGFSELALIKSFDASKDADNCYGLLYTETVLSINYFFKALAMAVSAVDSKHALINSVLYREVAYLRALLNRNMAAIAGDIKGDAGAIRSFLKYQELSLTIHERDCNSHFSLLSILNEMSSESAVFSEILFLSQLDLILSYTLASLRNSTKAFSASPNVIPEGLLTDIEKIIPGLYDNSITLNEIFSGKAVVKKELEALSRNFIGSDPKTKAYVSSEPSCWIIEPIQCNLEMLSPEFQAQDHKLISLKDLVESKSDTSVVVVSMMDAEGRKYVFSSSQIQSIYRILSDSQTATWNDFVHFLSAFRDFSLSTMRGTVLRKVHCLIKGKLFEYFFMTPWLGFSISSFDLSNIRISLASFGISLQSNLEVFIVQK